MPFKSKSEIYSITLFVLENFKQKFPKAAIEIDPVIEKVRISFENHDQNILIITGLLENLQNSILPLKNEIKAFIQEIQNSKTEEQTLNDRFENPWRRRFDSELYISLLRNPTKAMMEVVGMISQAIIQNITALQDDLMEKYITSEDGFLDHLTQKSNIIACGGFSEKPNLRQVFQILESNQAKHLPTIMFIHFKFAMNTMRKIPLLKIPERESIGYFRTLVEDSFGSLEEYRLQLATKSQSGKEARAFASNECASDTILYTQEENKGRLGGIERIFTDQLGLMLPNQTDFSIGFPILDSKWVPDAKGQAPDLTSAYVLNLIENEALYISGYSGMTALLLGLMEMIGVLPDDDKKRLYLAAIAAYIVGAGFHSPHEVLGPAEFCFKLIPNYQIALLDLSHSLPPNYHEFYRLLSAIDPEFSPIRDNSYREFIAWVKYFHDKSSKNVEEVKQQFTEKKLSCIQRIEKVSGQQENPSLMNTHVSNSYNSSQQMHKQQNLLKKLYARIKIAGDQNELENVIMEYRTKYQLKLSKLENVPLRSTRKMKDEHDLFLSCCDDLIEICRSNQPSSLKKMI